MVATAQDAIELLRARGMRMTPQRVAIVGEIMRAPGYVVPLAVIERIKASMPGVSASTVYRTLERLEELGVVAHVHLEQGIGYHQVSEARHAHLTCTSCGAEQEVSSTVLHQLERSVLEQYGFRPDFAHHPISGLCATCSTEPGA